MAYVNIQWTTLIVAALAHGADSALAETAPAKPAGDESTLEVISVTATRTALPAFDYPGMVSVLDSEQIALRQPSSVDDILKWVPNVEFTGGPRRSGMDPSIRGFAGPDVIVTVDGVRQNFDSGHDGRFFIDPSIVREAEVLRGGASALYGSGGTGGVIALRTLRAADLLTGSRRTGARVSAGYRSVNDEPFGTATVFARPDNSIDLLGSVTRRTSGTIELGDGSELDRNDDDILAGLFKAGWAPTDSHHLEATYQRFDNDAQEPNNGQGLGDDNLVDKDIRNDAVSLRWTFNDPALPLINLTATAYHNRASVDELRLDDLGAGPAGEQLQRRVETTGLRIENQSRLTLTPSLQTTLTYGVEGWEDEQEGAAGNSERGGVPDATSRFAGAFAQAQLRWEEPAGLPGEALIIPRLRFDRYTSEAERLDLDNNDHAASPSLGLTYQPLPWLQAFASYDRAFRAPAVGELFQTGVHFQLPIGPGIVNRFVPNSELQPQRTKTREFGAGLQFADLLSTGDALQFKVSRFFTDGEDFIDLEVVQPAPFMACNPFVPGNCDGITRAINVADAQLDGAEIEASYESRRARIALGFSTVDGENESTGEPLGVLTPKQWTVDAAAKFPGVGVRAGWRMLAAADFDKVSDPVEQRDSYQIHDFYVAWTPQGGPLAGARVDLALENAFDEAYSRVFTGALQPGRNVSVSLGYRFGR